MEKKQFEIVCSDELMAKIEEHCFSSTKTEVGGFLVGRVEDGKSIVTHVLKARNTANTQSQLTFTNKTWESAYADMGEIGPDAALIGWFHSHPNFGVFLSDYDKFIQNEFFKIDGMITIVVDPINGKRGWFISIDKEVRPYDKEENTTLEKLKKKNDDETESGIEVKQTSNSGEVSLIKVIAIAAIFSIFSFLAGFLTSGSRGASIDQIGALESQILALTYEIDQLKMASTPTKEVKGDEVTPTPAPAKTGSSGTQKAPNTPKKNTPTASAPKVGEACPSANKTAVNLKCEKGKDGKLVWVVNKPAPKKTSGTGTNPAPAQPGESDPSPSPTTSIDRAVD